MLMIKRKLLFYYNYRLKIIEYKTFSKPPVKAFTLIKHVHGIITTQHFKGCRFNFFSITKEKPETNEC